MRKNLYQGARVQSVRCNIGRPSFGKQSGLDESFCGDVFRGEPISNCPSPISALGLYAIYLSGGYDNGRA